MGVIVPTNKAQTAHRWVPYEGDKKSAFDWNNADHILFLNKWRTQFIRRTLSDLGIQRDGRKKNTK